jgi:hypothetical protein
MSTPQDPSSDTPQDPADPQNPYGTPPPPASSPTDPPTTAIPPAPPVYGTEPTGTPGTPPPAAPYGDPSAPPAPAAPAYGQPAYSQPAYPQQPGVPQYGATPSDEPGKGMAITALVASFLGCTCIGALVAIPLAIVVLLRSRDGRNHGKGLAIAALVISVVSLVAVGIGGYFVYDYAKDFKSIEDLKTGECITATGLTDEDSEGVSEVKSVSCSSDHDGQVLATHALTADEASAYSQTSPVDICTGPVTDEGDEALLADPALLIIALTQDASPSSGDKLVCVVSNADGSDLTSKLGG